MFLKPSVSKATIDRLPLYFRTLRLLTEEGRDIVSSEELGRRLDVTPEQIRKDLASFGQFGKKGVGYFVQELTKNLGDILGLQHRWNLVVVGLGHLGWALVHYRNFSTLGFCLQAIFDVDPDKVGKTINGIPVLHLNDLAEFASKKPIHIGVVTVPETVAQAVTDSLVEAGVKGIWNFAPRRITVPDHVRLINEDLSVGLSSLSYYISNP